MKYFITILLFGCSACAMDYSCDSTINNLSGKPVQVSVFYNKNRLDSATKAFGSSSSYGLFLKYSGNQKGIYFHSDTLRLINTFSVPNNKALFVNHNIGGRFVEPDYTLIEKISIQSANDTVVYYRKNFTNLFKRVENEPLWTLTVTSITFKK